MVLGDERLRADAELSAALGHVDADGGLGGGTAELVSEPLPYPPCRVWRCLRGALRSASRIPSTNALASSVSTGRALTAERRAGGIAEAIAWRTARRWTWCLRAISRLDRH